MGLEISVGGGGSGISQADADTRYVNATGDETVAGVKTFSSSPVIPTPTAGDSSTAAASTAYVQDEFNSRGYLREYSYEVQGLIQNNAPVPVGTAAAAWSGTISHYTDADGSYTSFASNATNGQGAGMRLSGYAFFYTTHNADVFIAWKESAAAEANYVDWIGIVPTNATTATPGANSIVIRFAHGTDAAHKVIITNNAAAITTNESTGIAANAGTGAAHTARFKFVSSSAVRVWMDGTYIGEYDISAVSSTAALAITAHRVTLENVAKNFRFKRVYVRAK